MKYTTLFFTLFITWFINSQIYDPVTFTTSVEKLSDNEYQLISTASIEEGWHLYSQSVPEDGPIATTFTYDNTNGGFTLEGATLEEKGHTVDDPVFKMVITYFEESAVFKQKVKVEKGQQAIHGVVEFMVCDDLRCLPPTEVDLVFQLSSESQEITKTEVEEKR